MQPLAGYHTRAAFSLFPVSISMTTHTASRRLKQKRLWLALAALFALLFFSLKEKPTSQHNQVAPFGTETGDSLPTHNSQKPLSDAEKGILALARAYPDFFEIADQVPTQNVLVWKDGTRLPYDDGREKSPQERLENPDLEDQMQYYPSGRLETPPQKGEQAGRIRYEPFFKKMYGNSAAQVAQKLTTVVWLPKHIGTKLQVTTVNQVHQKVKTLSLQLDSLVSLRPDLKKYLQNPGGTFNWRNISGTNRLSAHSFGMTLDINTTYSHYWQWSAKTKDENATLSYQNQIPMEIVELFEAQGFIWGGKWYHFDTMHFEYRPELLLFAQMR